MAFLQKVSGLNSDIMDLGMQTTSKISSSGKDFQKIMNATDLPSQTANPQSNNMQQNTVDASGNSTKVMKERLEALANQTSIKTEEIDLPEDEILSLFQSLIANIKDLIMETFQISEEDLNGFMQQMGITDFDLLNSQTISDLAVQISGVEDPMDLLLQPDFAENLKNLQREINNLKSDMFETKSITEEKVMELIKLLIEEHKTEPQEQQKPAILQENFENAEEATAAQMNTQSAAEAEGTSTNTNTNQNTGSQLSSREQPSDKQEVKENVQYITPMEALTNLENAVQEILPESDPVKIIRQIVQEFQISLKAETTSFEMQLTPEHLGKINLQVAAKDGVITAQIATENAAVKEAIEAQLQTLKESLNNQGLKVEAVEVTIASHEFERNLDEGKEDSHPEQKESKRKFRYDVGIDGLDSSEEELSQAEVLERTMMLEKGNRISYSI